VLGVAEADKPAPLIALVVRGDHELNDIKAEKLRGIAQPLKFASEQQVLAVTGAKPGSVGPIGLNITTYVDRSAAHLADFVCGANEDGFHLIGVNWERDCALGDIVDIRKVVEGDASPDGQGTLQIRRGIEVGHIFQLGTKYSTPLKATVLDENGKDLVMTMGCYGIGVSRVVAAAIEQNFDANGIIWPAAIAPFAVAIVPLYGKNSDAVRDTSEKLYTELTAAGIDVLLDDRNERPGVKFADMELIGIPHRITIGDRSLANGKVEYKNRRESEARELGTDEIVAFLRSTLQV